jgi:PAS domain S-box-containing protein
MNEIKLQNYEDTDLSEDLRADDHYYRSIIENNSFYVIKTDLEGNYTYLNPFFCQRLNLKASDWIGKPSIELIIPEDHQLCIDTVTLCFADMGQSQWVILRKPTEKGIISTQWEFKVILDESGQPKEVLCIGHDITSLIIKQQELQALVEVTAEQNKKLLNFTYIVSHNIRSHVANIIGIIEVNEIDTEEDRAMTWGIIKKSISSLDATIHNLNDIISIQSNTNLPVSRIVLKFEIERIIENIKNLFASANTNIRYNFDQTAYLDTNSAYLESIILNLLTNALKYKSLSRSLEIEISLYHIDNYSVLEFKDNGLGIDLDVNGDRIFGMYKTFHGNADAKGLGLFIIKTQIEALGGKIEVESKIEEYTTFKVYFKDLTES